MSSFVKVKALGMLSRSFLQGDFLSRWKQGTIEIVIPVRMVNLRVTRFDLVDAVRETVALLRDCRRKCVGILRVISRREVGLRLFAGVGAGGRLPEWRIQDGDQVAQADSEGRARHFFVRTFQVIRRAGRTG